jgi:hypothetical protein
MSAPFSASSRPGPKIIALPPPPPSPTVHANVTGVGVVAKRRCRCGLLRPVRKGCPCGIVERTA